MKALAFLTLTAAVLAQTSGPYVQFLTGIVNAVEPAIGHKIQPCLGDTTGSIIEVRSGFNDIKTGLDGNITAIFLGFNAFRSAFTDIRNAAADCGVPTIEADFERIINELNNNPLGVLAKLYPYAFTIAADLSAGVDAFKAGNFETAGSNVGAVLAIFLNDAAQARTNLMNLKSTPFLDFANGFLSTIEPTVGGNAIVCINDTDHSVADIDAGVIELYTAARTFSVSAAFQAMRDFHEVFGILKHAAGDCGLAKLESELDDLVSQITKSPLSVVLRLAPNIGTVAADAACAVSGVAAKDYTKVGTCVGGIAALVLQA